MPEPLAVTRHIPDMLSSQGTDDELDLLHGQGVLHLEVGVHVLVSAAQRQENSTVSPRHDQRTLGEERFAAHVADRPRLLQMQKLAVHAMSMARSRLGRQAFVRCPTYPASRGWAFG